jgi:hypothetical protein
MWWRSGDHALEHQRIKRIDRPARRRDPRVYASRRDLPQRAKRDDLYHDPGLHDLLHRRRLYTDDEQRDLWWRDPSE